MGWIDSIKSSKWWEDAIERAGKTFFQAYLAFWLVAAQVADNQAEMFDTLFTWDNVKAGVVGVALSLASSVISKGRGNPKSASLARNL